MRVLDRVLNPNSRTITQLTRFLWAAFLVALPVTSFPYFPAAVGGEALVRPLSLYPLLLLLPLAVLPRLLRGRLPLSLQPLALFVLIALASSLLALLSGIEPVLGIAAIERVVRGMVTLLLGCSIYLTTSLLPASLDDLRFTLRCLYCGFILAMLWGSLQMFALLTGNRTWFEWIARVQMFFSIRPLRPDRISGLTYEPHWFAEQMIVLLLPWVLGAILCGYSVWRLRRIPIEWLLFTWLAILLPFSYSRSGTVSLVSICLLGLLLWGVQHWHLRRPTFLPKAILVLSMVILSLAAIGSKNAFFARIWRYWLNPSAELSTAVATASEQDSPLEVYLSYLGLDARIMYAQAAYRAYLEHPWLGIGLGNYAFYVEQYLPDQPIAYVPEVLRMITPERDRLRLVTPKNLYVRLLGESGILGTIAFMTFGLMLFRYSTLSWTSCKPSAKYWGTTSLLALAAAALSAMTFDSFAFPNMWVVFGIITAASRVLNAEARPNPAFQKV